MSTFKINWVASSYKEWGEGNKKTYYFDVAGSFEGEDKSTSIGVKDPSKKPTIGQEIEGHFELINGREKFIKDNVGGFGGSRGYQESPEKQAMIVRQNALGNAVLFQSELAKMTKKPEIFTTENVLLVAGKFARFSLGELKPEYKRPEQTEIDINEIDIPDEPNEDEPPF